MTTAHAPSSFPVIVEVEVPENDAIYLERLSRLLLAGGDEAHLLRAQIEAILAEDEAEGCAPQ